MTVALLVMRTRVRVVNDDGLADVALGTDAVADEADGLVKAGLHRLGSVPVARRTKVLNETGKRCVDMSC